MKYYWAETATLIESLLVQIRGHGRNIEEVDEFLQNNELGLALETAISVIVDESIHPTKAIQDSILMSFYQMNCQVNILEDQILYANLGPDTPSKIDGGWVVARSEPSQSVITHFQKEFQEEIAHIVLVRYSDSWNELFLNKDFETATDNPYSNILECISAVHQYPQGQFKFGYSWVLNQDMCTYLKHGA